MTAIRKKIEKTKKKEPVEPKKEKKPQVEVIEKTDAIESVSKSKKYYEAVGRRKRAIARVRLFTTRPFEENEGKIIVNGKSYKQYFPLMELQQITEASLSKLKSLNRFEVEAKVSGGGIRAQSEAIRHGLARALVAFNIDFRKKLKRAGYLKRDPRKKERKKYGLKKARKSPQWAKR
ncbi:MAG: 30S ribosomal protein S9 [Candidatus Portnoybacteria bacterium]|nr:30S ribosomal protein S9 [Candidatus Portnoybacteria bacterium]